MYKVAYTWKHDSVCGFASWNDARNFIFANHPDAKQSWLLGIDGCFLTKAQGPLRIVKVG